MSSFSVHHCTICERKFHFKDMYDQHVPVCEFFYKSHRERKRDSEAIDALPTAADMFQLVKHVLYEHRELKEKVQKLELQLSRVKKFQIMSHIPAPIVSFSDWIKCFDITPQHLEKVFQEDLYEGFKQCISDRIHTEELSKIPLRISPERARTLYVWSGSGTSPTTNFTGGIATEEVWSKDVNQWIVCDLQKFMHLLDKLADMFLKVYCHWEDEHLSLLESTPENKDKHVLYLLKITGSDIANKDRRRNELRSWLCSLLSTKQNS